VKPTPLVWFAAAAVLGGGAFLSVRHRADRPCARPIEYTAGAIDPRFQATGTSVIQAADFAASIWNRAAGRDLFVYRPSAPLAINLIYDARQQNATLGVALTGQDAEQEAARNALYALQQRRTEQTAIYNLDVQTLNTRGGATPDEARALDARRAALDALSDSLQRATASFNERNTAIKSDVDQFNQLAGQVFAAGRFVRDSTGERIDVFRFVGDTGLTRLLAHEFGHALGLDHNADSASIMYAMDETGSLRPSAADMASVRKVCGT
jgi:hypothetical protein